MRTLVTWGSTRGGTEGIARIVGNALEQEGFDVEMRPADEVGKWGAFDAVILGGALYANRWHPAARRFVHRHEKALRGVPVWFFSSGPLDDSADRTTIEPPARVRALMDSVGAQGHVTFGGRLERDARGFPASAMAKKNAGDWRNADRIRAWASEVAQALPAARPRPAIALPGGSLGRLILHGIAGWALCALTMGLVGQLAAPSVAIVIHALAAPLFFLFVALNYFRPLGAREPLSVAVAFTSIVALLDLAIVAGVVQHSLAIFASVAATWLPLALLFAVTWMVGSVMSMMPIPKPAQSSPSHA